MLRVVFGGAVIAAVLAVLAAPGAHADPESDYLLWLSDNGFNVSANRDILVDAGNRICADLRAGTNNVDEGKEIFRDYGPSAATPKITAPQVALLVEGAQLSLCPDTIA